MSRANRVPRSLDELLRALDDHAYLAGEAALRLAAGESAQLRSLAAELRTLVCWSSGTEGLLWRLVDQVGALDLVDIQLGGWVNESHPLAQGLSFVFVPMTRAGANDPRLPRRTASLKTVVKEAPAVYLHGRHYTHEDLIRSVAQQMGSAHEDDGLDPHLVALRDIVMGKADLLSNMMLIDADLVMEVAGRVFTSAGFTAAPRPHVTVSKVPQLAEAPGSAAAPTAEGTITLLLNQPDRGWLTNDRASGRSGAGGAWSSLEALRAGREPPRSLQR